MPIDFSRTDRDITRLYYDRGITDVYTILRKLDIMVLFMISRYLHLLIRDIEGKLPKSNQLLNRTSNENLITVLVRSMGLFIIILIRNYYYITAVILYYT